MKRLSPKISNKDYGILFLSASVSLYGISFFGVSLITIGLVLFNIFSYREIFHWIKNVTCNSSILIFLIYATLVCVSFAFSINKSVSIEEIFTLFNCFLLIISLSYYDKHRVILILTVVLFFRSGYEIVSMFLNPDEWLGLTQHDVRMAATSLGGDPNNLALMLVVAIVFSLYYCKGVCRVILLSAFTLHFFALYSRGAFLSMLCALFVCFIFQKQYKNIVFLITCFCAVALLVCVLYKMDYVHFNLTSFTFSDSSSNTRLTYWHKALQFNDLKSLLIGYGPKTSLSHYGHMIHSSWVARLNEVGLFAFITYMLLHLTAIIRLYLAKSPMGIMLMTLFVGSMFVDFHYNIVLWMILAFAYQPYFFPFDQNGIYDEKD